MFTVDYTLSLVFFLIFFFFVFYNILLYFLKLAVCWEMRVTSLASISLQESSPWVIRDMWSSQLTSKHSLWCCTFCHILCECWHNVYRSSTSEHSNSQLWTTVKTHLWWASLSIFKLSVMRRDLSHCWQMSLWWLTPSKRDEETR